MYWLHQLTPPLRQCEQFLFINLLLLVFIICRSFKMAITGSEVVLSLYFICISAVAVMNIFFRVPIGHLYVFKVSVQVFRPFFDNFLLFIIEILCTYFEAKSLVRCIICKYFSLFRDCLFIYGVSLCCEVCPIRPICLLFSLFSIALNGSQKTDFGSECFAYVVLQSFYGVLFLSYFQFIFVWCGHPSSLRAVRLSNAEQQRFLHLISVYIFCFYSQDAHISAFLPRPLSSVVFRAGRCLLLLFFSSEQF